MCVALSIKVKGVSYRSPFFAQVGCGKCEECRAVYKSGWAFRINAQFQPLIEQGWKMCFFTLTYDNAHIPLIPKECYKSPDYDYYTDGERCNCRGHICFSRDDITDFTHHMRDWFLSYGQTNVQFFICSEFGDITQRSHYHGIYVVNPKFPTEELFKEIHRYWSDGYFYKQGFHTKWHEPKGFVFPRYYQGGIDKDGYLHKPFVVESPNSAMRYIAKYVTKDLAYMEHLQKIGIDKFDTKCRAFKRCMPFHVQTRSLGCLFLDKLTDEDKLNLLSEGANFLADKKKRAIPNYIKEKILFTPYYIKKHKRRLVRRYPTPFMQENYEKIFRIKCNFQDKVFARALDYEQVKKDGVTLSEHANFLLCMEDYEQACGALDCTPSEFKVAYYGQPSNVVFMPFSGDHSEYWIERYKITSSWQPYHLNRKELYWFERARDSLSACQYWLSRHPRKRTFEQREIDKTRDWWKHRQYLDMIA